jgi:DNA-binding NtrC family response regulator
MVGRAPAMRALYDRIGRVAPTDTTVLATGETGVGKELVARGVHALSQRAKGPFVAVNCAALAEGVLESELFGHVRGAFTGAVRDRLGVFEAAHGGTLFLDEIGSTTPAVQARLLRTLQEREVTRVGSTTPVRVDVRVVAATNVDLRFLVKEGRFREDLYYRLSVFPLGVPPLRERVSDIPLLVDHALTRLGERLPQASGSLGCSPFAMRLLRQYEWPGNVRQLFAVLESASILAEGGRIEAQHLPAEVRGAQEIAPTPRYRAVVDADGERAAIEAALSHAGGTLSRAADLLGMGRTTLWRKVRAYGIAQVRSEEPLG